MSGKAMSLKEKIRNVAKEKGLPPQVILQNYMFEHFLVRLSKSEFNDIFILKGGLLIAALIGIDHRATMDLDATVINFPLNIDSEILGWLSDANLNQKLVINFNGEQ